MAMGPPLSSSRKGPRLSSVPAGPNAELVQGPPRVTFAPVSVATAPSSIPSDDNRSRSSGNHRPTASSRAESISFVRALVSPRAFALCWLGLVLVHSLCAAFLGLSALVYVALDDPFVSYYADLLGPRDQRHLTRTGIVLGVLAAVHVAHVGQLLARSWSAGALVLQAAPTSLPRANITPTPAPAPESLAPSKSSAPLVLSQLVTDFRARLRRLRWGLFDPQHGLFGLEGRHFEDLFLVRECLEVAAQSWQVYRASELVASPWINRLYVAMLVANCWSTPTLQRLWRRRPALERVVCLLMDLVLGLGNVVVVPAAIFWPYARGFDPVLYQFDLGLLYDDVAFTNLVMANRQVFATSPLDLVARVIAHGSIFGCLTSIEGLLRVDPSAAAVATTVSAKTRKTLRPQARGPPSSNAAVAPMAMVDSLSPPPRGRTLLARRTQQAPSGSSEQLTLEMSDRLAAAVAMQQGVTTRLATRRYRLIHGLFGLWGAVLLGLHVEAALASHRAFADDRLAAMCKQRIRPWLSTGVSCAVFEFNCWRHGAAKDDDDPDERTMATLATVLEGLEPRSVRLLVFTHCPRFRMPRAIQRFRNLVGLEIYNATLEQWTRDAALTAVAHPQLIYVFLPYVNMTELPEGVVHEEMPRTLTDVEIVYSNLTHLPPDLDRKWPPLSTLYLEYARLEAFPPALLRLAVDDLSLIGNRIPVLPDEAFAATRLEFFSLALSGNPLQRLPEALAGSSSMGFLRVERTELAGLPAWVAGDAPLPSERVYLKGTPFCDDLAKETRDGAYGPLAKVTCEADDSRGDGRYPAQLTRGRRALGI